MMYLLWGLLNIGLLIYFVTIYFKAIKLVRREIGFVAAMVLVIGLLSFCSGGNKKADSNKAKEWTFASHDSLSPKQNAFLIVELQKNLISKYTLEIVAGKDSNNVNVPISAYTSTNGFILGTNWKGESIFVDKTRDNNKFTYYVAGIVEWQLLGMTVYTQHKTFNGALSIDKARLQ